MSEEIKEIWYYPNDVDKEIISGLCNEIIDILEPLRIEQKAFALAQLVSSFEDVSGIKFDAILTNYNDPNRENSETEGENAKR